jgi:hypothetical protein
VRAVRAESGDGPREHGAARAGRHATSV